MDGKRSRQGGTARSRRRREVSAEPPTFNFVNLGCPKNLVDSERLMGAMAVEGFVYQENPSAADICLVNTCGFLDGSRREAKEVLDELKALRGKGGGGRPKVVALGCLVERAGGNPQLAEFLAGVDAAVGFADYWRLPSLCRDLCGGRATRPDVATGYGGKALPDSYIRWLNGPAWRFSSPASAWLKLGEGCGNHCAYCAIPLIRGERVSRPASDILHNARQLIDSGAREICLCAQDTTAYGMDFDGEPHLTELLRELLDLGGGVHWRVIYAHPLHLTKDLLELMGREKRVCPYIDLPLQHVDSAVLGAMGRGYQFSLVKKRLAWIRDFIPGAAVRTTFITGHPGEGEAEFARLLDFVKEGHFDHVGVFAWSPEPGTRSTTLARELPTASPEVAEERARRLMRAQARVSRRKWESRVGQVATVFLEEPMPRRRNSWRGHTEWQAPDGLDGECIVRGIPAGAEPGAVAARIVEADTYGCVAEALDGAQG